MYFGVTYQVLKPWFHCFEMEKHMLGLAFTDSEEADAFANRFNAFVVNGKAKLRENKRYSENAFTSSSSNNRSSNEKKSLTQRLKGMYSRLNIRGTTDEVVLGEVTAVEHVAHIGIDKDGGINWSKIPHSWKVQFKNNGMKKKDFEKNPTLKKKLLTKLDVYHRNKRLAPPRPKSAKPKLRMSQKTRRVSSTSDRSISDRSISDRSVSDSSTSSTSSSSSNEISPEKLARYVETFKKMRTRVDDHIIRSAMKKKGIDPSLVLGPEKVKSAPVLPPREVTEKPVPPRRPAPRDKPTPPRPRVRPRQKPTPPKPRARPTPRERTKPRTTKPSLPRRTPKLPPRSDVRVVRSSIKLFFLLHTNTRL